MNSFCPHLVALPPLGRSVSRRGWRLLIFRVSVATLVTGWTYADRNCVAQTTNFVFPDSTTNQLAPPGMAPNGGPTTTVLTPDLIDPLASLTPSKAEDINALNRFDIYLSSPEVPKDKVDGYLYDISLILSLLGNHNPTGARNVLPALSQYSQLDTGLSEELAGKIDSVLEIQKLKNKVQNADSDLQKAMDTPDKSSDEIADAVRKQSEEQSRPKQSAPSGDAAGGPDSGTGNILPPPAGITATPELTQDYIRNVEIEAKITANERDADHLVAQAKTEFSLYIKRLYSSHHYYHVVMAAGFYRQIFNEDPTDAASEITNSLNINTKVIQMIKTFHDEIVKGEVTWAADQLRQAHLLSDTSPEVLGIPADQKATIKALVHGLVKLRSRLEARDFSDLDSVLLGIRQAAPDFDAAPTKKIVDTLKAQSEGLLKTGELLLKQGDVQGAVRAFQKAGDIWPGNPGLRGGALPLLNFETNRNQSLLTFDQLVGQRDFQALYARSGEFSPMLGDDPPRKNQLQCAIEMVDNANSAKARAQTMEESGDVNGAWEIIQYAVTEWPDNVELNKKRAELAEKAADFSLAIRNAQYAEGRSELGLSLSWYATAQHYYPASKLAQEAITRLAKEILGRN